MKKIGDASVQQPVPQIAYGSAENEREGDAGGRVGVAALPKEPTDADHGDDGETDQHSELPGGRAIGEQAEGGSAILDVRDGEEVWNYVKLHDVPYNPLYGQGYGSIGCTPCTTLVQIGEDPRAGRWRGKVKTECGLHK